MNDQEFTLELVSRQNDNGDGGWTVYFYNTTEELLDDHPLTEDGKVIDGKWVKVPVVLTEEQKRNILNEEDPYENGYIGNLTLRLKLVDGKLTLAKPTSAHFGQ